MKSPTTGKEGRLGDIDFESACGGEGFANAIGFLVFQGVDDDLAGESVAEGVEGGTLFPFLRT